MIRRHFQSMVYKTPLQSFFFSSFFLMFDICGSHLLSSRKIIIVLISFSPTIVIVSVKGLKERARLRRDIDEDEYHLNGAFDKALGHCISCMGVDKFVCTSLTYFMSQFLFELCYSVIFFYPSSNISCPRYQFLH